MSDKTKAKKLAARKEKIRIAKHEGHVVPQPKRITVTPELFPDSQYHFWLAHGVNYIVSDYKNGNWQPLFPGIYEGHPISLEQMSQIVVEKFGAGQTWTSTGKAALAWSVLTREVVYIYYREALQRIKIRHPKEDAENLVVQPHNPVVWEVLNWMLKQMTVKHAI